MLGIIIVDYKGAARTIGYVRDEISKIKIPYKVVIVNNAATEESNRQLAEGLDAEVVTAELPPCNQQLSTFVLPAEENLGFACGNNLGAKWLIDNFGCDYLLFSNNDLQLQSPVVVEALIERLHSNPKIGMIGPEVVGLDGRRQSPEPYLTMGDRLVWMYLATPFMSKERKAKRFHLRYADHADDGAHYRIMGAFFVMPTESYRSINGMDSNTFLYAEEMILAERLKAIGQCVWYCPDVTVIHAHGATTSKHLHRYRMAMIEAESESYYYTTYCGVPKWQAWLLKTIHSMILRIKFR